MLPNDRTFNGKSSYEENGITYYRYNTIEQKGIYRFKIKFVSVNSPYKQGIALKFSSNPEFEGILLLNGKELEKPKRKHMSYVIKEGVYTNNEVDISIELEQGFIAFCNASNTLTDYLDNARKMPNMSAEKIEELENKCFTSGFSAAHMYGNAFWVEIISDDCYRFHCNDHKMDDDFDDLIFDLEVLEKNTGDG